MALIGFHASHELFAPGALLRHVRRAERVGFGAAMCSDHLHPWVPSQGQSGYSFAWLGAAMQATALPMGTICCPVFRYHPAVVAQAAATLAEMFPGRFWLALGTGQALNEHVTGQPWPDKPRRREMVREAAETPLWAGHYPPRCTAFPPGPSAGAGSGRGAAPRAGAAVAEVDSPDREADAVTSTEMPYRPLGGTGQSVSAIGLGGWLLGLKHADEQLALRIVRSAIDRGIMTKIDGRLARRGRAVRDHVDLRRDRHQSGVDGRGPRACDS